MALYSIEFQRVEYYYASETIEADSKEQAEEIGRKMEDSTSFGEMILHHMTIDDSVLEFTQAYEVEPIVGRYERHVTLTADEIKKFMED